jgi:large subunit ribosomal protein L25
MKHLELDAWTRVTSGTSGATSVRNEGCIPGILIGLKETPVPLKVKAGDMTRILKEGGSNALVDLSIDGQNTFAMLKQFTRNPVSRKIIHVDFQRVSATETVEAAIPIVFVGQPAQEYENYVMQHEVGVVHVKAFPDALPGHINVDVSQMLPSRPLHTSDIIMPEGVTLIGDPTATVAVLMPPKTKAEAEVEAPVAVAEAPAAETE